MRERLWVLFGLLLGVSFAVQVALPVDLSETPETTYETAPRGHAALFDLLARFDSVRGRWLSGLSMPPPDETVWWIAAPGVCDARVGGADAQDDAEAGGAGTASDDAKAGGGAASRDDERTESVDGTSPVAPAGGRDVPFRYTVEPWIEAGGTAIVWLSHPPLADETPDVDAPPDEEPQTREVVFRGDTAAHTPRDDRGSSRSASDDRVPRAPPEDLPPEDGSAEEAEDPERVREQWHASLDDTRAEMREGRAAGCRGIAGFTLPARRLAGLEGGELPLDADSAATAFPVGRFVARRDDFDFAAVRTLPGATLAFFDVFPARWGETEASAGWQPLWVEADDFAPFAIQRPVGSGRLIVVADARVLTNGRLAKLDSAPFVFDWVEDFGVPWIDEHRHGVVAESGTFRYLATSPAWAACLGLLALGALVVWRGHALPRRRVQEVDPEAPTLATFVDGLAALYAGTRDHASAFERYRALSLERIRRALGLSPGTPVEIVLASLRARAANRAEGRERGVRDLLTRDLRIESAAELARAAARLDALVDALRDEQSSWAGTRRPRS